MKARTRKAIQAFCVLILFCTGVRPGWSQRPTGYETIEARVAAADAVYQIAIDSPAPLILQGWIGMNAEVIETIKGNAAKRFTLQAKTSMPLENLVAAARNQRRFLLFLGPQLNGDVRNTRLLTEDGPDSLTGWSWFGLSSDVAWQEFGQNDGARILTMDLRGLNTAEAILLAARNFGAAHAGAIEIRRQVVPSFIPALIGSKADIPILAIPFTRGLEPIARLLLDHPETWADRTNQGRTPSRSFSEAEIDSVRYVGLYLLEWFRSDENAMLLRRHLEADSPTPADLNLNSAITGVLKRWDSGRIEGVVVDSKGNPVSSAYVVLALPPSFLAMTWTDAAGRFAFGPSGSEVLVPGEYELFAWRTAGDARLNTGFPAGSPYQGVGHAVSISTGALVNARVTLTPPAP